MADTDAVLLPEWLRELGNSFAKDTPLNRQTTARLHEAATRIEELEAALRQAADIARHGCLVPPDGGSPTDNERLMCEDIAHRISLLAQHEKAAP